jgi:hypothetical protein
MSVIEPRMTRQLAAIFLYLAIGQILYRILMSFYEDDMLSTRFGYLIFSERGSCRIKGGWDGVRWGLGGRGGGG